MIIEKRGKCKQLIKQDKPYANTMYFAAGHSISVYPLNILNPVSKINYLNHIVIVKK